jgi:hypothetical protein
MEEVSEGRIIGIVHRVKFTADGEASPTKVAIADRSGKVTAKYNLETETDELDFMLGRFPLEYSEVASDEDLSQIDLRHLKWRKAKKGEVAGLHPSQIAVIEKKLQRAVSKPIRFGGLQAGDTVVMTLGGSGDRFAFAINNYGKTKGINVLRIQPSDLKDNRKSDKSEDHLELIRLYSNRPELFPNLFHEVTKRDEILIHIKFAFDMRMQAMKDRIACGQRLKQRLIGKIFLSTEGFYPEGAIEDLLLAEQINNLFYQELVEQEEEYNKELEKLINRLDVYRELFSKISGIGPRISAPLLAYVGDIRRFSSSAKFKMYCGVAPNSKGGFVRKKRGQQQSWRPEIRQALFLFADQCNRRPESEWGRRFLEEKARLREKYPNVVVMEYPDPDDPEKMKKTKLYTDGHIHKKARWHLLGQFCDDLYGKWTAFYDEKKADSELESAAA